MMRQKEEGEIRLVLILRNVTPKLETLDNRALILAEGKCGGGQLRTRARGQRYGRAFVIWPYCNEISGLELFEEGSAC